MNSTKFKQPTAKQIADWKKEHGEIRMLVIGDTFCIVRFPTILDLDQAIALNTDDEHLLGASQLESCWLYGDPKVKEDLGLYRAASKKMGLIFPNYYREVHDVEVTPELIQELKKSTVSTDQLKKVQELQTVLRKITVFVPTGKILETGLNEFEQVSALFFQPDQSVLDKVASIPSYINKGTLFLQDCWLSGDDRLLKGEDPIKFSACVAGHALLKDYEVEIVKL